MIRIVVADDQPLIRNGIKMMVQKEKDIDIVAEAANGQEAVDQVRSLHPDVVLMDVRMSGIDGIAATRTVIDEGLTAQNGEPTRVIILTTFHQDEYVSGALRAGASGFLLKDAPPAEIATAIRAVAAGDAWLNPTVTRRLIGKFADRPDASAPTPAQMARLTDRELEVLILLAEGLSNADVAKKLSISEATTKTHLAHVMTKLRVREKAHAIIAAYQSGLVKPTQRHD